MSGIPVYTSSPIKPQATSSPTAETSQSTGAVPTTTALSSDPSYPAARPAAPAVPAPTGAAQRYVPMQPTPTTTSYSEGPPPPQPGAFPQPNNAAAHLPPPPKAGEKYQPPQPASAPMPQSNPPQMNIPPPTTPYAPPYSSTSTSKTASASYPVGLATNEYGIPQQSLHHPPGYQQNTYASELSSDQRRAQEATNSSARLSGLPGAGPAKTGLDAEGIWNTAKQWAQSAGAKIQQTEAEVWRRINKE